MAHCVSNPATHRQGCGAEYRGQQSHCVARAAWSTHPDGLCHETFSNHNVSDKHWTKAGHVHPSTVKGLEWSATRGLWQYAGQGNPFARARITAGESQGATQTGGAGQ